MSWKEFRTTAGPGHEHGQPTISKQTNTNAHPWVAMSRGAGNLVLDYDAIAGTTTITSSSLPWTNNPEVGDDILISGFTNATNNGRFTVTAIDGYVVTFVDPDVATVDETLTSTITAIKLLKNPVKYHQDVIMTSGLPTYSKILFKANGTVYADGGVYSYISAENSSDIDAEIIISGGKLLCPAGGALAHEVKPFTNNVTCDLSTATSGYIIINIS